jgi:hypothetical protein
MLRVTTTTTTTEVLSMSKEALGRAIGDLCGFQDVPNSPMLQMTFDGELVPTKPHPDDQVECSDGTHIRLGDAWIDCTGQAHRDDEARREANTEFVHDALDSRAEWACDYTQHEDYGDGYCYLVKELHHGWKDRVKEWIDDDGIGHIDWDEYPELLDYVVETVWEKLYAWDNWESIHEGSDFSAYYGDGCCLAAFEVGECEEQVSLSDHPEFAELHDKGELEAILEDYNGDLYISENDHYDKETKTRIPDGYVSKGKYPDILGYVNPGGQWQYVVSKENMDEAVDEAITEYAEWEGV